MIETNLSARLYVYVSADSACICNGCQHILGSRSGTTLSCCGIFAVLVCARHRQQCQQYSYKPDSFTVCHICCFCRRHWQNRPIITGIVRLYENVLNKF